MLKLAKMWRVLECATQSAEGNFVHLERLEQVLAGGVNAAMVQYCMRREIGETVMGIMSVIEQDTVSTTCTCWRLRRLSLRRPDKVEDNFH